MEENDIVLINTPPASSRQGIREILEKPPIPSRSTTIRPPVQKDILYQGKTMYAKNSCLYTDSDHQVAWVFLEYNLAYQTSPKIKAASMMYGTVPVFAPTQEDLDVFLKVIEKVDIEVEQGSVICFFVGKEVWIDSRQSNSNIRAIVYQNGLLRIRESESSYILKLNLVHPIRQTPEEIFKSISSFLKASVKGVLKTLYKQKENLAVLESKKQEDIYNYLYDMEVGDHNRQLHRFLLAREEESYANCSNNILNQKKEIAVNQNKILSAKGMLPSGRKGIALRNAYLKAPILADLLDNFEVSYLDHVLYTEFTFRKDLVVENINYGRPIVSIAMDFAPRQLRGGFILESKGVTVRSADNNAFTHPHIETDQRWCLGTFILPINNAIVGGNIPLAATLIWQYLSTYNIDSPLINLELCRSVMSNIRKRKIVVRRK